MVFEQLSGLYHHCQETNQTPTEWLLGPSAERDIIVAAGRMLAVMDDEPRPTQIMGVPYKVDRSLPERRVVLRVGQNTVGAFSTDDTKEQG